MGSGRVGRAFKLWPVAICLSYWAPRSRLLGGDNGTWDCWPPPPKLLWVGREHRVLLLVFWTGEALGYKLSKLVSGRWLIKWQVKSLVCSPLGSFGWN